MSEQFSGKHEFYPARSGGPAREISVVAPNPNANIGRHPSQQMLDNVSTLVRIEIPVPAQLHTLIDANVVVIPAATGNLSCIAITDYGRICADEVYNTHSGSVDYTGASVVPVTINEFECIDIAPALVGLTGSDWIGLTFTRGADSPFDTVNANLHFIGVRLRYT